MTSLLILKSLLFASFVNKSKKKKKLRKKRDPKSEIKFKRCRICNIEKGLIPIFNNEAHPNICEEIKNFSGVTITHDDNLPKHMCQECMDLLNGCIKFRDICQKSNKLQLEHTIKKEYNTYNNDESINLLDYEDSCKIPSPVMYEDNSEIWDCSTCGQKFCDLISYNNHLNKCTSQMTGDPKENGQSNKKTFLCDICGKIAKSKGSLAVHRTIHENVFPYKCDMCSYRGRTMDLLKVHKRSHLVDKPYKCTQCPKATTTTSNLAKHMRHVHSTNRPYKCSYCDKAFSYQHDMKSHVKDIHLRQGRVECDVCFKKFNTKKILQGHRWKIHKIKGGRHGRIPSYLQCKEHEENGNTIMSQINYNPI